MSRVFANGPGDRRSIPGRVIPKTQKMVLGIALLNTQHYKVWIKGKVVQSIEKRAFGYSWLRSPTLIYQAIGLMSRVFTNGPEGQGSIPGRVIPKTQKMVLGAALLNTQHYKVQIKGKVEQSRERSSTLPYTSV